MRTFLLGVLFTINILFSTQAIGQTSVTLTENHYNTWYQVGNTCYGCSSFFIMVVNEPTPTIDGRYYYNIYLWSNSFYNTGYVSSTYLKNVKFYLKDITGVQTFVFKMDYALVPPKSDYFDGIYHIAYVYSGSARQIIKMTWEDIGIW